MILRILNQTFVLLPEGGVLLDDPARSLVVADVHLGKSAAFRARGLAVPEGDDARDLERLKRLVTTHHAGRLIIAGDLFHAAAGMTPELKQSLETFVRELAIPICLVEGNHDAKVGRQPLPGQSLLDVADLRIVHDPADATAGRVHVCGHWHPVARIAEGRRSLRMPCFLLRGTTLVLPAFGSFTGGGRIPPQSGDRCFVALREGVVELPPALIRRQRR